MTDNLSYTWRDVPLKNIMPKSHLLDKLSYSGFDTAGDIMDVDPELMVLCVKGIGLRRATQIRQKVYNAVRLYALTERPDWDMIPADLQIIETIEHKGNRMADIISAACLTTAIGLISYLIAWFFIL